MRKAACALTLVGLVGIGGALALPGSSRLKFTKHDKSYYSPQDQIDFVRPGIVFKINQAQVAPDGTVSATFSITDPQGLPLDLNGATTPGPVKVGMTLATIYNDGVSEQYTPHITKVVADSTSGRTGTQGALDEGGTFRQVGPGLYTYTFATNAI